MRSPNTQRVLVAKKIYFSHQEKITHLFRSGNGTYGSNRVREVPLNARHRYLESLELYPSGTTNDKSVH